MKTSVSILVHSLAVRTLMQCCIVTSRLPPTGENREGRLSSREGVIGLLNARLVPLEILCQEPVFCSSGPPDPRRPSDEPFYGLREAVRLDQGNKKSAP